MILFIVCAAVVRNGELADVLVAEVRSFQEPHRNPPLTWMSPNTLHTIMEMDHPVNVYTEAHQSLHGKPRNTVRICGVDEIVPHLRDGLVLSQKPSGSTSLGPREEEDLVQRMLLVWIRKLLTSVGFERKLLNLARISEKDLKAIKEALLNPATSVYWMMNDTPHRDEARALIQEAESQLGVPSQVEEE